MPLPPSFSWFVTPSPPQSVSGGVLGVAGNRVTGVGKTGLALPFGADGRGRLALLSGEDQLRKIVILNLLDLDSSNPFQGDIGLGADMIFAVSSDALEAEMRRRINALFRRLQLQDRARLAEPVSFSSVQDAGELVVEIRYVNLEENKPGEVTLRFSQQPAPNASAAFLGAMR